MPDPRPVPTADEFSPTVMNDTWDMSNATYPTLLEKQRELEEVRAKQREEEKKKRGVWRRIVDTLVPV